MQPVFFRSVMTWENKSGTLDSRFPFQKIPNVVNTDLFYPSENAPSPNFPVHSYFLFAISKKSGGNYRAFIKLLSRVYRLNLVLVGPLNPSIQEMIKAMRIRPDQLHCTGEIPYDQVAVELRKSSSLVMFSFYENMPCVILEALCSGLPVIATRVGGIPEIIGKENGILINVGKETELLDAMKEMIRQHILFISRDK